MTIASIPAVETGALAGGWVLHHYETFLTVESASRGVSDLGVGVQLTAGEVNDLSLKSVL